MFPLLQYFVVNESSNEQVIRVMLQTVRVFLMVRELSLTVRREPERQLPLSKVEYSVKENEVLDLSMLKFFHVFCLTIE